MEQPYFKVMDKVMDMIQPLAHPAASRPPLIENKFQGLLIKIIACFA